MKIAFVHDWLTGMRGGEKVLEAACELFPEAEIFTLIHRQEMVSQTINRRNIHTSWLQNLPFSHQYYRYMLPLMPAAIQGFRFDGYDLVVSFSHCVAKGVRLNETAGRKPRHVSYCFTPMRYIYSQFEHYFANGERPLIKQGAQWLRPFLRRWDQESTRRVDYLVGCSENVRRRIQSCYDRDAEVLYPPVDTDFFTPDLETPPTTKPYYLMVGALVPYKRADLAIAAARLTGIELKIIGVGTEERRLRKLAEGAKVEFLHWQPADALRRWYQGCEALLFPQEEDFGIAAVEAMACGKPVIAYGSGGALETVEDGKTGIFFQPQTPEALAEAIRRFQRMHFEPEAIRVHASRFSRDNFKKRFAELVLGKPQAQPAASSLNSV